MEWCHTAKSVHMVFESLLVVDICADPCFQYLNLLAAVSHHDIGLAQLPWDETMSVLKQEGLFHSIDICDTWRLWSSKSPVDVVAEAEGVVVVVVVDVDVVVPQTKIWNLFLYHD